jgi:hypothetical protein
VSRVSVVLDATALLGYAKLDIAVGELLSMIAEDEDSLVGVPAAAYLAACWELDAGEYALLQTMVTSADRVVEVLPLLGVDAAHAADIDRRLRSPTLGHAIIEAQRHGATLATYRPDAAARLLDPDSILDLGA